MTSHFPSFLRLYRSEFKLSVWLLTVLFVMGHTFTLIILQITKEPSAPLLAGVLLPCVLTLLFVVFAIGDLVSGFDLFLRFGATRHETIRSIVLEKLALVGLSSVIIIAFTAIERAVFPPLWMKLLGLSQLRMEELVHPEGSLPPADTFFAADFSLDWWWTPLILVGALLAGALIGAVIRRFGRQMGTALYLLWILLCITTTSWLPLVRAHLTVLLPALVLAVLAGLVWMVHYLLHTSCHT